MNMDGLDGAALLDMLAGTLRKWTAHTQPSAYDALMNETLPQILVSFALCYALDGVISRLPLVKSRWFSLHTVVNAMVVMLAAEDTFATLADPVHATTGPATTLAVSLIIALHVYHAAFFTLDAVDVIHHVVSVGILGPLAVCYRPGVFLNYVSFFVSGLPGGVDYAMLALVKHGYLEPLSEKYWNSKINVWMRGPMLVIGAFIAYQSALETSLAHCAADQCGTPGGPLPRGQRAAALITAAVLLWNGQFFAERVIVNFGAKSKQSTAEMYAGGMLPRNLSKGSLSALARNLSRDSLLRLAETHQTAN
ncbi:hypothetical protein KFE25_001708 [Diacronema lutheri]|uniref:TLC domain-containing protein n=1 Tax=Diacronema lutheri TaxID=2081491 RepID=A0A8J6CAS9_DIALT|nr:hypothetical protein KFE25_001708 [Diacronema lutheri]